VHTGTVLVKSIKTPRRSSHNHNGLPQLRPFKTVLHLSRLLTERTLIKVTVSSDLNKIPGVYMQQALNTNRISIGSRAQYGTQK
jgi:hypothetical protein